MHQKIPEWNGCSLSLGLVSTPSPVHHVPSLCTCWAPPSSDLPTAASRRLGRLGSNVTSPEPPRLSRCPTLILFLTPPRLLSAAQPQLYLFYPAVVCLPQLNGGPRRVGTLPCSLLYRRSWQKNRWQKTFVGHIRNRDTNDSPFPHVSNGSGHATHSLALTHNHLTTCLSPRPEAELARTDPL